MISKIYITYFSEDGFKEHEITMPLAFDDLERETFLESLYNVGMTALRAGYKESKKGGSK